MSISGLCREGCYPETLLPFFTLGKQRILCIYLLSGARRSLCCHQRSGLQDMLTSFFKLLFDGVVVPLGGTVFFSVFSGCFYICPLGLYPCCCFYLQHLLGGNRTKLSSSLVSVLTLAGAVMVWVSPVFPAVLFGVRDMWLVAGREGAPL